MEDLIKKELLPIGSVVILEEGSVPIMVAGRMHHMSGSEGFWDYVAVPYPEGIISPDKYYFFNRSQIKTLLFMGFQTEREEEVKAWLEKTVEQEISGRKS